MKTKQLWLLGRMLLLILLLVSSSTSGDDINFKEYLDTVLFGLILVVIAGVLVWLSKDESMRYSFVEVLLFCPFLPPHRYCIAVGLVFGNAVALCSFISLIESTITGQGMIFNLAFFTIGLLLTFVMVAIYLLKQRRRQAGQGDIIS